jgi:hypothetical protein
MVLRGPYQVLGLTLPFLLSRPYYRIYFSPFRFLLRIAGLRACVLWKGLI